MISPATPDGPPPRTVRESFPCTCPSRPFTSRTDLGFLLHKHLGRAHETDLPFGKAHVLSGSVRGALRGALVLDIDPVALVRGKGRADGLLDQYVNDRPYAASSFLSVAMARALRTAMAGTSRERPELAEQVIPLEVVVTPLPARGGGVVLVRTLFEPLGWTVDIDPVPGVDSDTVRYVTLRLTGTARLRDLLNHLHVLIPVLDDDKHDRIDIERAMRQAALARIRSPAVVGDEVAPLPGKDALVPGADQALAGGGPQNQVFSGVPARAGGLIAKRVVDGVGVTRIGVGGVEQVIAALPKRHLRRFDDIALPRLVVRYPKQRLRGGFHPMVRAQWSGSSRAAQAGVTGLASVGAAQSTPLDEREIRTFSRWSWRRVLVA
jgi:hypothetical protein